MNLMFQYSSEMIPAQISNPFKPKRRVLMSCLHLHVIIQTVQSVLCNLCLKKKPVFTFFLIPKFYLILIYIFDDIFQNLKYNISFHILI